MRIVVTRPPKLALHTSARLLKLGHEPIIMSLSYFTHNNDIVRAALRKPYAAIPSDICSKTLFFAVGKTSATATRHKGCLNVFSGKSNGIHLAKKIIEKRQLFTLEKPLLYLAGHPRSYGFEDTLSQCEIPFTAINCYHTHNIAYSAEDTAKLLKGTDIVLFYSRENVLRFFSLPLPYNFTAHFLCLSSQIAQAIPESHKKAVSIARIPQENALLNLL